MSDGRKSSLENHRLSSPKVHLSFPTQILLLRDPIRPDSNLIGPFLNFVVIFSKLMFWQKKRNRTYQKSIGSYRKLIGAYCRQIKVYIRLIGFYQEQIGSY